MNNTFIPLLFLSTYLCSFATFANSDESDKENCTILSESLISKISNINLGDINISDDAKIGDIVAEKTLTNLQSMGDFASCLKGKEATLSWLARFPTYNPSGYNTYYDIGVPGVGLMISVNAPLERNSLKKPLLSTPLNARQPYQCKSDNKTFNLCGKSLGEIKLTVYKVSNKIISNSLQTTPGHLIDLKLNNKIIHSYNIASSNVIYNGCRVTTPSVVDLGLLSIYDFKGLHNESGHKNFSINVNCPRETHVELRFDGKMQKNSKKIFKLNDAIDAKKSNRAIGVGLKIDYLDRAIEKNRPITVMTGESRSINLDFTAYYVQILKNIKPGDANATVTVHINYP